MAAWALTSLLTENSTLLEKKSSHQIIYYKQRQRSILGANYKKIAICRFLKLRLNTFFWCCPFDSTSLSVILFVFLSTLKYELPEHFWTSVTLVACNTWSSRMYSTLLAYIFDIVLKNNMGPNVFTLKNIESN